MNENEKVYLLYLDDEFVDVYATSERASEDGRSYEEHYPLRTWYVISTIPLS